MNPGTIWRGRLQDYSQWLRVMSRRSAIDYTMESQRGRGLWNVAFNPTSARLHEEEWMLSISCLRVLQERLFLMGYR